MAPIQKKPIQPKPRIRPTKMEKTITGVSAQPHLVNAGVEFRSPALFVGGMRLIEPAKMRPPKAALLRTGNVFGRVRDGVVQAMIRNPARRVAGAVEDGPEDQELLDELVGLDGL